MTPFPAAFPRIILWAREAKQDLRFVKPGIALLERTVWLHPEHVRGLPQAQSLLYPSGVALMAVVRLEVGPGLPVACEAAMAAAEGANAPGVSALQIDFDAKWSERVWYAEFLRELRRG